jgi:hypothetical protein
MAIIDMFKTEKKETELTDENFLSEVDFVEEETLEPSRSKADLLSFFCVRLLFFVLACISALWMAYAFCKSIIYLLLSLTLSRSFPLLKQKLSKSWLSLKRSFICEVALCLALFSPSLGIMIACTYFLMYDKAGIEEVIPSSLREQFKDLFSQVDSN